MNRNGPAQEERNVRRSRAGFWRRGLVRIAVVVLIGVAAWLTARDADQGLRTDLLQQARIIAATIHMEHVAALRGTEADPATPEYQELKQELTRIRLANPNYRFVYLMGLNSEGQTFFYVDSEPPDSKDYSPPGQIYEAEGSSTSWVAETEGPLRDAWGTWVSAFLPLVVEPGAAPVALGMDIAAGAWTWIVVGQAALPVCVLVVALLLALLVLRLSRAYRGIRQREAQLRESFQTSADLVRAIPSGLYLYQYTPPDRLTLIGGNPEAERLTGLRAEDHVGKELDEIWPDSRRTGIKKTYLAVMRTGKAFVTDGVLHEDERVAGGFRVRAFPLPGDRLAVAFEDVSDRMKAEGQVRELLAESNEARVALLGILEDEKRAEESLRESEGRFSVAFRTSPYAITITRLKDGQLLEVNDAFTLISGYTREEALANSSIGLGLWADEEDRRRVVAALEEGRAVLGLEFLFRRRSGEVLTGLFSAQVIILNDEPCVLSSIDDITERKRADAEQGKLREQLAQAQKMEYVGRLAGGVAHDFNNLLMGIMNYVELCRDAVGSEHPARAWLDEITRDAQRSADLTRQLLAFARRQTIAPMPVELNEAVPSTLKMLRRLVGEDVDVVWEPGVGPMTVKIDPTQLDQILVNLAVNARDAIGGAGRVTIGTGRAVIDAARVAESVDATPGTYVALSVSDNGSGMSRETMEHIFEPFFTTKGPGEGTGLGLATVYGIVKQNGGFIDVSSALGQGSTFCVYLPQSLEEVRTEDVAGQAPRPRGQETILIAEDEKSIRVTLERFLEDLGYRVLAAPAADAALKLAAEHGGKIDLLITDVVMPGMSGRALAERLASERHGMRCLFISGYTADVIVHHGVLDADTDFLAKPFTRDGLARKVREILDR
jgi:PAS domain S-box-containing protein